MKMSFKLIVFVPLSLCLFKCKSPSNETEKSSEKNAEIEICVGDVFMNPLVSSYPLDESILKGPVKKVILRHFQKGQVWDEEYGQTAFFRERLPTSVAYYNDRGSIVTRKKIDETFKKIDEISDDEILSLEEYQYDEYGNIIEFYAFGSEHWEPNQLIVERDAYGRRILVKGKLGTIKYYYQGCDVIRIEYYKENSSQIFGELRYDSTGNLREVYEGETLAQTYDYDDQGNVIVTFLPSLNKDAAVNVYNKLGDPLSLESSPAPDIYVPVTYKYSGYDQYGNWTSKTNSGGLEQWWEREIEYYE